MEYVPYVPIRFDGDDGEPALRLVQTIVYYERPLLFIADWRGRGHFIVVMTSEEDGEEWWLASPVSAQELLGLGSGAIDFRSAFLGDGGKTCATIHVVSDQEPEINWMESREVAPDDLPEIGVRMPGPWLEESTFSRPTDARAIFRVIGEPERADHPHPKMVGELFKELVALLELGVAAAQGRPVDRRGPIPRYVSESLPLSVAGFSKGSFGIVLDSESIEEPLYTSADHPPARLAASLNVLSEVLTIASDQGDLRGVFRRTGVRYARHLRRWLELGFTNRTGLAVEWVSAREGYRSQTLPPAELRMVLNAVREAYMAESEEELEIVGRLTLVNESGRRFTLRGEVPEVETGEFTERVIRGVIDRSVPIPIPVPANYKFLLRLRVAIDPVTGFEQEQWTLLGLEPSMSLGDADSEV